MNSSYTFKAMNGHDYYKQNALLQNQSTRKQNLGFMQKESTFHRKEEGLYYFKDEEKLTYTIRFNLEILPIFSM